jgi:hypothetical protein
MRGRAAFKRAVEAWIAARRAEGCRVTPCLSCGSWFAQRRTPGRRSWWCGRQRCDLWAKYQNEHNQAPPEWMELKWFEQHGNAPRKNRPKLDPLALLDVDFPADRTENRLLSARLRTEAA